MVLILKLRHKVQLLPPLHRVRAFLQAGSPRRSSSFFAIGAVLFSVAAQAEVLGEPRWLAPWVETSLRYSEPRNGEFQLAGARFGGRWEGTLDLSSRFEAQVSIGTRSLVARPTRYAPLSGDERGSDPALVDAYAGLESDWGHFRVGLVPVLFGLEEGDESARDWVRPLVMRQGILAARDLGFFYQVDAGGFESSWLIHNGEAGDDRDREIWATARTEYKIRSTRGQLRVGLSGQAGRTAVSSTHPTGTTSTATELDADKPARLRYGGFHIRSEWEIGEGERGTAAGRRLAVEFESIAGETQQDILTRRSRMARFDLTYEPLNRTALLLRYDAMDPDTQASADLVQEMTFGAQFYLLRGDFKRAFRLLFLGTKEMLEGRNIDQHRFELAFRFSPEN